MGCLQALQEGDEGLEDDEEDDPRVVIALGDPLEELEHFRDPLLGHHLAVELGVQALDILPFFFRNMEVFKAVLDQNVVDRSEGILQIDKGEVNSPVPGFGILDDFLDDLDVLNTSVDLLQKGFLNRRINVIVFQHKLRELISLDMVEDLP